METEISRSTPEFTLQVAQAVRTLQAGQRETARRLFARAVRADPGNATAWFWLSRAVEDERQREDCLARVRELDRLALLQAPVPGPADTPRPPAVQERGHRPARAERRKPARPRRAIALWIAAFLALAACVTAPLVSWQSAEARTADRARNQAPLEASGIIRAEQVLLSSEYGGRIEAVLIQEGESVRTGQVAIRLDTSLIDAQIETAQAAVDLAEAGLAEARAGARPGQIAIAEAQLAQAEQARLAAQQAVSDTMLLVENPQDIQLQIAVMRAQTQSAEHKVSQALALKDAAEIGKDNFYEAQDTLRKYGGPGERTVRAKVAEGSLAEIRDRLPPEIRDRLPGTSHDGVYTFGQTEVEIHGGTYTVYRWVTVNVNLPFEAHLLPNVWWQAWVGVNAAAAEKEGLEASLNGLYDQRAHPQELQARVDQAIAALAQSEAHVAAAQAQVDGLKAGAMPEQIHVLQARIDQANATLEALRVQRAQLELTAPIDGMVVALSAHTGEIAAKGAALATLADLSVVQLDVYLPEQHIGRVALGDRVRVTVDSFPDRVFDGTVSHIADTAEFTPRNVATKEERVNLVFAVQIALANDDGALKPGMPADAVIGQ